MKKQIYLIGFMGAGKSAVARTMAKRFGALVLEMDAYIEQEAGMKISEIFATSGEEAFRQMETRLLLYLSGACPLVVSCGGGVAMREENVEIMRKNGLIVYLKASPQTVYKRVKDHHDRPLLENNMSVSYISELMEKRRPRYEAAADVTICSDDRSLEDIALEIWKLSGGEETV